MNLSELYKQTLQLRKSIEAVRTALSISNRIYGETSIESSDCLFKAAQLSFINQDFKTALNLSTQVLANYKKVLGAKRGDRHGEVQGNANEGTDLRKYENGGGERMKGSNRHHRLERVELLIKGIHAATGGRLRQIT